MGVTTAYTCDECGKLRDQANHWFIGRIVSNFRSKEVMMVTISKFTEVSARKRAAIIICGESCLAKFASRATQQLGKIPLTEQLHKTPDVPDHDRASTL